MARVSTPNDSKYEKQQIEFQREQDYSTPPVSASPFPLLDFFHDIFFTRFRRILLPARITCLPTHCKH